MVYNENDYQDDPDEPVKARPNAGDWLIVILSACLFVVYLVVMGFWK